MPPVIWVCWSLNWGNNLSSFLSLHFKICNFQDLGHFSLYSKESFCLWIFSLWDTLCSPYDSEWCHFYRETQFRKCYIQAKYKLRFSILLDNIYIILCLNDSLLILAMKQSFIWVLRAGEYLSGSLHRLQIHCLLHFHYLGLILW